MKWVGLILLSLALFFSPITRAEKMDRATTDLVIAKLERALPLVKDQSVKYVSLLLRLGDLYSERGRQKAMQEFEDKCDTCVGAKEDRLKAIDYYNQAFPEAEAQYKGAALFQMAHLYRLVGQGQKASALFFKITSGQGGPYNSDLRAAAYVGVGEVYYTRREFKKALESFSRALRYKSLKRRGFVIYRRAWSQLNVGQTLEARRSLVQILTTPAYLRGEKTGGIDRAFQMDVSRDLATIMARGTVSQSGLEQLIQLSPEKVRRENVFYLGGELARLGKKASALMVFDYFLKNENPSSREEMEISVRVAQLNYDMGQKALAASYLEKALKQWKRRGCDEKTECEALRIRMRNLITHWNKDEKAKPTLALLKAYQSYVKRFPNDQRMIFWTATTAKKLKKYKVATQYFRMASQVAAADLKSSALQGEIEAAELSKSSDLKLEAYNYYLIQSPKAKDRTEILYQRAYVFYEKKQYNKAATEFRAIAVTRPQAKSGRRHLRQLRLKSADLAIDSLVVLKDDQRIEIWAIELARALPERKIEYLKTSRQASLKIAQKVLNNKKSTAKDLNVQIAKLRKLPYFGAQSIEVKKIFGTRLALAERSGHLGEIVAAARALLKQPGLSKTQKQDYLTRQAWAEEMRLNFKAAYKLNKKLNLSRLSAADRHLKMAMLADLAGYQSSSHLRAFIKATPSRRKANRARAQLIRRSRAPWKEIKSQMNVLKYTPDILAELALDSFARYENIRGAKMVLNIGRVRNTQEGTFLARYLELNEYLPMKNKLARHKIVVSSPYMLKRTLGQRIQKIGDLESWAKKAVHRKDWVLQLVTLSDLKREYKRLTDNILSIPYPKGLTKVQQKQYEKGLSEQVKPYRRRVAQIDSKLKDFWRNDKALDNINKRYRLSPKKHRRILSRDLHLLKSRAPSFKGWSLARALKSKSPEPKSSELKEAWKELRESPFNTKYVSELRQLESRRGSETTVAYLDLRLSQIKKYRGVKR